MTALLCPRGRLLLWVAAVSLLLASCAGVSKRDPLAFKNAPLLGMVYDHDNRECPNVHLVVDGKDHATTDINGRFILPNLTSGVHKLLATKSGYEPLEVSFDFTSPTQVLYLKVYSFDELLKQAELALRQEQWQVGQGYLHRAAAVKSHDVVLSYLEAILAFKKKEYGGAAHRLEALVASGSQDPSVYLFLADLYQYRLARPAAAVRALESYLKLADDPGVEARLQALEQQTRKSGTGKPAQSAPASIGAKK